MQRPLALLIVAVVLVGCTMPKTMIYSITTPPESALAGTESRVSVALRVDSARYLSQPYIASRTSPYELELSRYAKWDAPPREIVTEALRSSLVSTRLFGEVRVTSLVAAEFYSLRVDLKRFEALSEGGASFAEVLLQAELSSPQGRELFRRTIAKRVKLEGAGFSNLAKGLSSALGEGLEELMVLVAETLGKQ
jgi:uncharacterized lipoprotein YmbA